MNVLKKRKLSEWDDMLEVWLVDRGHEYATYLHNTKHGDTFAGNYFNKDEYDRAEKDFWNRIG